jgi:hypothetical protein
MGQIRRCVDIAREVRVASHEYAVAAGDGQCEMAAE